MILATASALHGHNTLSKGVLIAASAVIWGALTFLLTSAIWLSLVATFMSVAWWFVLRGGKQASLELDYMDTINKPHPRLKQVMAAHYWTGWLTCLSLELFNYSTAWGKKLGWNHGRFWDVRRPTEIATGLTGDAIIWGTLACLKYFV